MDYLTKPMTRLEARILAKSFRELFGYDDFSAFNPIRELDRMHLFIKGVSYEIVKDDELSKNVHCTCKIYTDDKIVIQIKESVYLGALKRNVGGYLMDITHEMAHAYLYSLGYKPISDDIYDNNEIPAYKSIEWQAKAVAGEIMIPFEGSKGMDAFMIIENYCVSFEAACKRLKL